MNIWFQEIYLVYVALIPNISIIFMTQMSTKETWSASYRLRSYVECYYQ